MASVQQYLDGMGESERHRTEADLCLQRLRDAYVPKLDEVEERTGDNVMNEVNKHRVSSASEVKFQADLDVDVAKFNHENENF